MINLDSSYPTSEEDFYTLLNMFLNSVGARYNADLGFNAVSGATRIAVQK